VSKRRGKSVLGAGKEFSWVGAKEAEAEVAVDHEENQPAATALEDEPPTETAMEAPVASPEKEQQIEAPALRPVVVAKSGEEQPKSRKKKAKSGLRRSSEDVSSMQRVGIYIDEDALTQLKVLAVHEKRSVSAIINELVVGYCKRKEHK
jgi:hypothetical protein